MSSLASQLARARLQTINLPPDRVIHTLTSEQAGGGSPLPVLYKKQGGNLGKGSFGVVHLEIRESECEVAPRVRAVKTIDKDDARKSNLTWQREIENLIAVSKVRSFSKGTEVLTGEDCLMKSSSPIYLSRSLVGGMMKNSSSCQWSTLKMAICQDA